MFTGIVAGTGRVDFVTSRGKGRRLGIRPSFSLGRLRLGESVAVNGCCLTVAAKRGSLLEADLSRETLRVTNLGNLRRGDRVNLERPVRLSDRLGGHLVAGHVDGVGRILGVHKNGSGVEIRVGFPASLRRYLIPKGSVAVDGISMTVNRVTSREFTLVVIPHTLRKTNLAVCRRGDPVNLEVDIVGKYIESFVRK